MKVLSNKNILLVFLSLTLYLQSLAQEPGMISITSKPSGATVTLNGNDSGKTTPFQKALSAGKYSYTLNLSDFKDYKGEFELKDSELKAINAVLIPLYIIVKVSTDPESSKVFINNKYMGKSPLESKVLAGDINLKITKRRFKEIKDIFIDINKSIDLQYNLEAKRRK